MSNSDYKEDMKDIRCRRSIHDGREDEKSSLNEVSENPSDHPAHYSIPPQQMKQEVIRESISYVHLNIYWHCLIISICVVLHVIFSPAQFNAPASQTPEPTKNSCSDHLEELSRNFSTQDKFFWPAVYSGLKGVLQEESRPSIITFLYNDSRALEVFKGIVNLTKDCINPSREPIVLTGEELNGESIQGDHGVIIEKYKPQLADSQIMLVEDLQNISAVSSRIFHDFCDTYSPIVDRYVVYFTLLYTEPDRKASETASDLASNLLKRLWDDKITPDVAAALIARVTDQTLFLNAP